MSEVPDHPPETFLQRVTPDQALAFLEALTGSEGGRLKSPHAMTALMSVLGAGAVPRAGDVVAWVQGKPVPGFPANLSRLVQCLRAVAAGLEQALPREDGGKR